MVESLVVAMLLSVDAAGAWDWPQWRGPNRDATSNASRAPNAWPGELTHRWRSQVGAGQSSPVVAAGSVFVFSREEEMEVARAVDLRTGKTLWRRGYAAPYGVYAGAASYGSGPKSTPVLHESRLFTLGISGILTAFDVKDGRIVWQKTFAGRFKAAAPPFGTSMSPLLAGGLLIVHAGGHEGGALIGFDPPPGPRSGPSRVTAPATPPPSSRPSWASSSSSSRSTAGSSGSTRPRAAPSGACHS